MKKVILKNLTLILGVITMIISIIGFVIALNKSLVQRIHRSFDFFNKERKMLQKKVFPEIKIYCSANKLNFQTIGLR